MAIEFSNEQELLAALKQAGCSEKGTRPVEIDTTKGGFVNVKNDKIIISWYNLS